MKKNLTSVLLAAALAQSAQAQTAQVDVVSSYTMRGREFGQGVALQPSATLSYGPCSAWAWGNRDPRVGWNELDLYTSCRVNANDVHVDFIGGTFFFRHAPVSGSSEASVTVTRGETSAFIVHDWRAGKGTYGELAYTRAGTCSARTALGFDAHYFRERTSFSHLEEKLSYRVTVGATTITPSITYIFPLNRDFSHRAVVSLSVQRSW